MSTFFDEASCFPSPLEQFAGLEEWQPTSPVWQEARVRSADVARQLNDAQRVELIQYLQTGLVRAFSTHAFVQFRFGEHKSFSNVGEALGWIGNWRYDGGGEQALHGCFTVPKSFWKDAHHTKTDWVARTLFPFISAALANWKIGKFGALYDRASISDWGHEPQDRWAVGQLVCLSVEFLQSDLEAVFGKVSTTTNSRSTKYDWEAAFADVAAAFYHDVEFENLEAQGVQKQVIDLLRSSFEDRGLAVPSDDTIKPKARAIVGALRGKKP